MNVSDSGYNSEQFSPQCYSSLPPRRPSQLWSRRCKSTCSIVLSGCEGSEPASSSSPSYEGTAWHHRPAHQHAYPRYQQFTTLPEVCEDCTDNAAAHTAGFATHFCTRLSAKPGNKRDDAVSNAAGSDVIGKTQTTSKDASSQTTDVESRGGSTSTISRATRLKRKPTPGPYRLDEQMRKKQENESPSSSLRTTGSEFPADSEKSDSSTKDDSSKRKSRTVHIDVYCTGSDDESSVHSSMPENDGQDGSGGFDSPVTVFENPSVKVTHTRKSPEALPRGFQNETAILGRSTEAGRHAPMRLPSLASSKGYDSDDLLSSLYPSQFSSYSALRDLDSIPWTPASSNTAFPFDYESTAATSAKDTFSDIESILHSKTELSSCDSFEYANSSDRERMRKMEAERENRDGRTPQIERKYHPLQTKAMREYVKRHRVGWSSSSSDTGEESDESGTVGWSFLRSDDDRRVAKRNSVVRRESKDTVEPTTATPTFDPVKKSALQDVASTGFSSNSASPAPSKITSRVTSPFTTAHGEKTTTHLLKASVFGPVISAFRKPGHHVGPAKNPLCSCDHCRRHFEELGSSRAPSYS